jgi:site-specific recombinase XerD
VSCRPHHLLVELSAARARVLNSQADNQLKSSAYCHPISTIAPVLGHENLVTTEVYLSIVDQGLHDCV